MPSLSGLWDYLLFVPPNRTVLCRTKLELRIFLGLKIIFPFSLVFVSYRFRWKELANWGFALLVQAESPYPSELQNKFAIDSLRKSWQKRSVFCGDKFYNDGFLSSIFLHKPGKLLLFLHSIGYAFSTNLWSLRSQLLMKLRFFVQQDHRCWFGHNWSRRPQRRNLYCSIHQVCVFLLFASDYSLVILVKYNKCGVEILGVGMLWVVYSSLITTLTLMLVFLAAVMYRQSKINSRKSTRRFTQFTNNWLVTSTGRGKEQFIIIR